MQELMGDGKCYTRAMRYALISNARNRRAAAHAGHAATGIDCSYRETQPDVKIYQGPDDSVLLSSGRVPYDGNWRLTN